MVQIIIVILVFAGALFYLGRKFYKTFSAKKSCENCSCSVVDVSKMEKEIRKNSAV